VLLFLGPMHNLSAAHNQKATVANVGRVHRASFSVQHHHASSTASCNEISKSSVKMLNFLVRALK
jgi:hypothetical protein